MTEKIREYKMNGSLIIGVDAGYGNFKTARRVFPTAVTGSAYGRISEHCGRCKCRYAGNAKPCKWQWKWQN